MSQTPNGCHPAMRSRASLARPRALASQSSSTISRSRFSACFAFSLPSETGGEAAARSEEHTSELQSRLHLVCRLLLEKKKKKQNKQPHKHTELHLNHSDSKPS